MLALVKYENNCLSIGVDKNTCLPPTEIRDK